MAKNYGGYGDAVSDVLKYKKWWHEADAAGDEAAKTNAANSAADAYIWLNNNGYQKAADNLHASNYDEAKKWVTNNATATRPYLYSLGQNYGLSNSDVDKIVKYDNANRNISIGGKNIGTADVVVDGVSYWNDPSKLDNAFSDYVNRAGVTKSDELLQAQHNTGIQSKIDQLWGLRTSDHANLTDMYKKEYEDIKKTNPFATDEAKTIMGKYSLDGLRARDNAVASGGATNGGNIDSYSAGNAMRQQAYLANMGQMAVLDAHQARVNNARSILSDLGVYQNNSYAGMQDTIGIQQNEGQRLFENSETSKNNETDRLLKESAVTGYVPRKWQYSNNPYFNSDGTLNEIYMSEEFDNSGGFTTIINNAKEKLATTTDATEKANLQATITYATQAKAYKTLNDTTGKYAQYANEVSSVTPQKTEEARQFDKTMDYNYKALETGSADTRYGIDAEREAANNATAAGLEAARMSASDSSKRSGSSSGSSKIGNSGGGEKSEAEIVEQNLNDIYGNNKTPNDVKEFIRNVLIPKMEDVALDEEGLKNLILTNSSTYDLEVSHIKAICEACHVDTKWVDDYKNSGWFGWGKGVKEK